MNKLDPLTKIILMIIPTELLKYPIIYKEVPTYNGTSFKNFETNYLENSKRFFHIVNVF
jgi:hypothetical protein